MKPKKKKIVERKRKIKQDPIKIFRNALVYWILYIVAILTVAKFIALALRGRVSFGLLTPIIFLAFLFFFVSYVIYKKFPTRFIEWVPVKKYFQKAGIKGAFEFTACLPMLFLIPPGSVIILSISLSFYIFSLLSGDIAIIWQKVFNDREGPWFLVAEWFLVPVFIFIFALFIRFIYYFKKRLLKAGNTIKVFIIVIFLLAWIVFMAWLLHGPTEHKATFLFEQIYMPFLMLLVGAFPLGWFYELFIGSIGREERSEKEAKMIKKMGKKR